MPLVSVCIPTYNGARYLPECLDSVCSQTYEHLEILVVDDCSSDQTVDIVEQYHRADQRIRLVRNEYNLGLVGNWDRTIALARGEYVKFVFQDDLLHLECIESLVAGAQRGARFVFCARDFIFADGTSEAQIEFYRNSRRMISELFSAQEMIGAGAFCRAMIEKRPKNVVGEPTVTLIHRDVFDQYGCFHPDMLQICDFEFWCRVATNETTCYVPKTLATFRVHAGSMTSQNISSREYRADVIDQLLILHEFAFAPVFGRLREKAEAQHPSVDFVDRFYEQAHWVRAWAREKASEKGESDRTEWNTLETMAARYPALLTQPPLKYQLARKLRSVGRRLGQWRGTGS